jgi:hypothetical protein
MASNMFDQIEIVDKFGQIPLMYSLLFFLINILEKDLQTWKLTQVLHAFHDSHFSFVEGDFM